MTVRYGSCDFLKYFRQLGLVVSFYALMCVPAYGIDSQRSSLDGVFYPKERGDLETAISECISNAGIKNTYEHIIAIISPHAGYQYSGPTAGFCFKAIKGKSYNTVIITGPSHRHFFNGAAVLDKDAYQTPLGSVYIDKDMAKSLVGYDSRINYYPMPFVNENSIETQIPFIQYAMPEVRIVPVLIGDKSYETCLLLAEALHNAIGARKDVLIVSSTDMSHFHPEDKARSIDMCVIDEIKKFQPEELFSFLTDRDNRDRPCGSMALVAVMIAAKKLGADTIDILRYETSASSSGNYESVVGYMSAVICCSKDTDFQGVRNNKITENKMENTILNSAQRSRLLEIARESIRNYLYSGKKQIFKENDHALNRELGLFVTLHKNSKLRGCIGNIIGRQPLYAGVSDMALEAAFSDPRFEPVTMDELANIEIEISVLSPLEKIDDPNSIVMGKHGVLVKKGFRSGVYLPQVALETGWSREEFMDSLCAQKAGIAKNSWKLNECDIYIFTAEVFGEKNN